MHTDGLQTPFIFSHPTITNILILVVFFMNLAKYKDNKIYYWITLTTLISATITLIFSSDEMASNIKLLIDRDNIFNYFFRLHKIILPSLYLIFYIFLDKNTLFKKKKFISHFHLSFNLCYIYSIIR
ncbi:putative membrane protein [Candidatus Phytoplasma solani]|uniref:hypothetical protein n=1 Tax=Candidatus Phytoplasma solani TaxID=69896 RepID=UPI0032DB021E